MWWLIISLTYLLGWFLTSVMVARFIHSQDQQRQRCHGETRRSTPYIWSSREDCFRYCHPGCWRPDEPHPVTLDDVGVGSLIALVWPLVLPVGAVYLATRPRKSRALLTSEALARLEKEAGIEPN